MTRVLLFFVACILSTATALPQSGINPAALEKLLKRAEAGHSDGVVLYHHGRLIGEWYFDKQPQKVDVKSVTKSITNLAVGVLVTQNKLDIDQRVAEFYPGWDQEGKRAITVRHLLTHTSGLLNSDFALVENTPDAVALALASDLTYPVGTHYDYNNKAVNLLAGIIERADGRKMDVLLQEELFTPLGITDFTWPRDSAGNPYCMAFLQLYPIDLATIGQLVLAKGNWKGKQLIDAGWFDESIQPGAPYLPEYGLLWELIREDFRFVVDEERIAALEAQLVHPDIVAKGREMLGVYEGYGEYYRKVRETFGPDWSAFFQKYLAPHGLHLARKEAGKQLGFMGMGYLGQYLVIYPDHELIAVRLINHYDGYNWDTDEITEFPELVLGLVE